MPRFYARSFIAVFACVVAALASGRNCTAQESAEVVEVSADVLNPRATIAPEIYGQFAEHLGRCVNGGLWVGEDSKIPNVNGYRQDVLEALKQLKIPVLRWPGGCFADDYHWRDGIGPRDQRPRTLNIYWGGEEDNSFGTHEFMELCEILGAEAYVAGNVGSGTVEEMREWVEYLTSNSNSTLAELRRKNGRDKPWRVRYFGVGNENWGCGGNMTADYYADLYRRYATYVRNFSGNEVVKVANGPSGRDVPFMDTLIRKAHEHMDAVSMHYYVLPTDDWSIKGDAIGFDESKWFSVVKLSYAVEDLIDDYEAILDEVDPEKRIALYVDEWGTWYDKADKSDSALYQQNSIRDAVSAALFFNIFHDHSDRIRMSNIAQVVNVLQAMILTDGDRMVLTPTYHVFEMYKVHQGAKHVPLTFTSPVYELNGQQTEAISLTASLSPDGKLNVSLVNTNPNTPHQVSIKLKGFAGTKATGRTLTGPRTDSHNTFDAPNQVQPQALKNVQLKSGTLTVKLAPKSVSTIVVER